jgi:hypothetical protein
MGGVVVKDAQIRKMPRELRSESGVVIVGLGLLDCEVGSALGPLEELNGGLRAVAIVNSHRRKRVASSMAVSS